MAPPTKKTIPITHAGDDEDLHDNTKFSFNNSTPATVTKLSPALPAAKSQLHFGGTTTLLQTQEEFARRPKPNLAATDQGPAAGAAKQGVKIIDGHLQAISRGSPSTVEDG